MTSQKQKIIRGLALNIGKILDSNLKHITETQGIIQEMKKTIEGIKDINDIDRLEEMLKKEERYLTNKSKEKDSLVLLTMDEVRYNDTKQKLEKMFQDIKTHVIEFYEKFYPQFETLYSILGKSPRGKSSLSSSSSFSSNGFYVLLALTLLLV
jgi:hypothetical protein